MSEHDAASPGNDPGTPGGDGAAAGIESLSWQEQFLAGDDFAELRENETIKTTTDIPSLAKRLVETKALVGRKGVILPKEDAPPEEWDKVYAALGRPEAPEAYDLSPEGLPDDFPYSTELEGTFRQMAHQAGLNQAQVKKIYDGYNQAVLQMNQAALQELQTQVEEMQTALHQEWGGKYEDNLALARSAMNRIAPPGSPELLALDKAIGGSPVLVKFFYNIGKSLGEGDFYSGGGGENNSLEAKRAELMRHPAYLDPKHAEHKTIVEQVTDIYNQLHPKKEDQ